MRRIWLSIPAHETGATSDGCLSPLAPAPVFAVVRRFLRKIPRRIEQLDDAQLVAILRPRQERLAQGPPPSRLTATQGPILIRPGWDDSSSFAWNGVRRPIWTSASSQIESKAGKSQVSRRTRLWQRRKSLSEHSLSSRINLRIGSESCSSTSPVPLNRASIEAALSVRSTAAAALSQIFEIATSRSDACNSLDAGLRARQNMSPKSLAIGPRRCTLEPMELAQCTQAIGFLTINAFQEREKLQQ